MQAEDDKGNTTKHIALHLNKVMWAKSSMKAVNNKSFILSLKFIKILKYCMVLNFHSTKHGQS